MEAKNKLRNFCGTKAPWKVLSEPTFAVGKGKGHPRTGHEGPEGEYRYSSILSLTTELDGVGGQRHSLAALPPGKTRYPLYRRLGGPQGWSWTGKENLAPHRDSISGPYSR
jgi:hypothetical protein